MKIYIDTLGCPKNFYDSEVMGSILENCGHLVVLRPEDADVIVVNTCGFINDAKKESINRIFEMAEYDAKIVVSGCLSQRYSKELLEEMPEVDLFIGVNEYEKLPELLLDLNHRKEVVENVIEEELFFHGRKVDNNRYSSTLKIAEGCNNRCAYCVIPYIRGGFRSKRIEEVVREARFLASQGTKELILIAQDTTYYGMDLYGEMKLPELLKQLCEIEGIQWIRLMYCYEDRITDELIDVIREHDKICNYLDIPIQHASNSVLSQMNRRSTEGSIRNTLQRLRDKIPGIAIRTTLITGFPGETEEDFDILYDFVAKERFERLGVFSYSQEEGTPAGEREDQVDEDIKEQRTDSIMRLQMEISRDKNQSMIGNIYEVIIDELDQDGSYLGRTRYDAPEIDNSVLFTSRKEHKPGDIVNVKILDAFDYDLTGEEVFI